MLVIHIRKDQIPNGSVHDSPDQQAKDRKITNDLEDAGGHVIRFRYNADWQKIISSYANVFGNKETRNG